MTYEDTLKTLDGLRSLFAEGGDDSVFDATQKRWISALYRKETGEGIAECGCKNKYTDAVLFLSLRLRKRGALDMASKYRLRRGVLIWIGNDCYSRLNLTDEKAAEWLAAHPEGIDKFEKDE